MTAVPNFSLRPAKHVQRRMIVDALTCLEAYGRLSTYRYVGMGSRSFGDFRLFHKHLGIRNMISMEMDEVEYLRAKFNQPYACIDLRHERSGDTLSGLAWDEKTVFWIDAMSRIEEWLLDDAQTIASNAEPGSVLIMSAMVSPFSAAPNDGNGTSRVDALETALGDTRQVPHGIDRNSHLNAERFPEVTYRLLCEEILDAVQPRDVRYRQLFNFKYRDKAPMITLGGVFLDPADQDRIDWKGLFEEFPYLRGGPEPYEVVVPELTLSEMRKLDRLLPVRKKRPKKLTEAKVRPIPLEDAIKYAEAYRHVPSYVDADVI
jgi:hypothetical protein